MGAFVLFIALSFAFIVGCLWFSVAPAPWLPIVIVAVYATVGEPMLEAALDVLEHLERPPSPSSA